MISHAASACRHLFMYLKKEVLGDVPVDRETLPPGPGVGCNSQGFRLQRDMTGLKQGGCVSLPELSHEVLV